MKTTVVWFHSDLRVADNPALYAAAQRGAVVPVFIYAPEEQGERAPGAARHVVVREASGQTVQFPASLIQRFVTADGVHGHFALTCDDQNKHASLQRLAPPAQA